MKEKSNLTLILLIFQLLVACTITVTPHHSTEKKTVTKHTIHHNTKRISTPTPTPSVTPTAAPIIIVLPVTPAPNPTPNLTPTPTIKSSPSKYYWAPFPKATPAPEPHEN
jgi:hypothetical protein